PILTSDASSAGKSGMAPRRCPPTRPRGPTRIDATGGPIREEVETASFGGYRDMAWLVRRDPGAPGALLRRRGRLESGADHGSDDTPGSRPGAMGNGQGA